MKWVSFAFGLLGVMILVVVARFWQEQLGSADFKFALFVSQLGGPAVGSSGGREFAGGLSFLRAVPWACYGGAVLSVAGIGLVISKGRVAAIPLLVAAVLLVLPLGLVALSDPDLGFFLYAGLAGGPSALAGLLALAVRGKPQPLWPKAESYATNALSAKTEQARADAGQSMAPLAGEPRAAEKKGGGASDKRLWVGGVTAVSLCLLLAIWAARSRTGGESEAAALFYPGPVALSSTELFALGDGVVPLEQLVAVEWNGVWYAARVLSSTIGAARVRFVGWGSEWDEEVTPDRMRTLPQHLIPQGPAEAERATARLGSATPSPCAWTLSLHQPEGGLDGHASFGELPPKQTLYSSRLDLADVSLERALAGSPIRVNAPFALTAVGTVRVDEPGQRYFSVDSNGATRLWIDGKPVDPGSPVELDAGAHELRVEHRHERGSSLTLRLQAGTKPEALRTLDMGRDGVAQFARYGDAGWRLVLDESLLFDFDRAELKPSAERALSSIYGLTLSPAPTAPVTIEGHTDDRGAGAYNADLSRRRAETVRGWLTRRGRASSSLEIRAYGETRPRVSNDTDAHRKLNRRVELVIGLGGAEASQDGRAATPAALSVNASPAGGVPLPGAAAPGATHVIASGGASQGVLDTVNAYYRELNDGTFDANRYFEPAVERYITMMSTSTAAINHYIRDIFPKQFKEHHFELEEGSLSQQSPGEYVYVERSRYLQAGKQQSVEKRVRVRILVSPAGKIVSLHQFQRL